MTLRERAVSLLREPLVQFLLAGTVIFPLFSNQSAPEERRIVIDATRVERIASQYEQAFRSPPSSAELDNLIREDIKDEVYYREALRLGLDKDDLIVRRRMRSKMEAFADSANDLPTPDDATLTAWMTSHPDRFTGETSYTFEQRYLGAGSGHAAEAVAALASGKQFAGEAIPIPPKFADSGKSEVVAQFGDGFAKALDKLELGKWVGPVRSSYGEHVVLLRARNLARPPRLEDVRQRVENDWRTAQAKTQSDRAYNALLDGYQVVIQKP